MRIDLAWHERKPKSVIRLVFRHKISFDARPPQNASNRYRPSDLRKGTLGRIAVIFRYPTAIDKNDSSIIKLERGDDMKTGIAFIGSTSQEHFLVMLEGADKRQTAKFDIIKSGIGRRNSNWRRYRTRFKTGDQVIFPLQTLQLP